MTHQVDSNIIEPSSELILQRNLQALRKNNEALAAIIESADPDGDIPDFPGWRFIVRISRSGQPTMLAANDETEVAVHSTYDPVREANDQVNGALADGRRNYFVVLGFGLGYVPERLMEEIGPDSKILVVEPHINAFRKAIETRDLSSILGDKRLVISFTPHVENAQAAFIGRYNLSTCTGVGFIELAGRQKLPSSKFYSEFLDRLKGVLITTGGNLQTLMLMAWTYQKNTMGSLGMIIDHPPVRALFDAFENKPAIIISAGPSLQKNIDQLKDLRDRAVLIAVDTSLRPLLAAGVEPHLVCTGDPQEANWRHLRGTESIDAHLVAEPMTYSASLDHFKGRLFIASYEDKVMSWLQNFIPKVGHTMCWGSVATMAFDLARKIGCDPIIFIGQDLSFPGGRTYVKGTYFEDEEGQDMSVEAFEKGHTVYSLEDIYGNQVKTNRQMYAYKEWFRTEFGHTDARVVNATEGGILRERCEIMTLKEAAGKFLNEKFDAMALIREQADRFQGYNLVPLNEGLKENVESIQRCIKICEKGINRIREALQAIENMDNVSSMWAAKVIRELDGFRFEMMKEPSMNEFLVTANQSGILNFQRAYRLLNGKNYSRVVFRESLDLFTSLFMSTGRTARGVLPFHAIGYKIVDERCRAGLSKSEEETCLTAK